MKSKSLVIFSLAVLVISCALIATPANAQTTLKVAAVQTPNLDRNYEKSLETAEAMIEVAAAQGAQIVVLPEFALIGYVFHDDIWDMAEPLEGPTVAWMKKLAKRHDIFIATCILELRGDDFHDTMVLVGPREGELWAHRKIEPALFEARYFRGGGINPSVFDTRLGRIGVSICMDNTKAHTVRNLLEGNPDILLMAYSAPETPLVEGLAENTLRVHDDTPELYASILDVPVVSCNKTGPWNSPLPGVPGLMLRSDFIARSKIVDADGNTLAKLHKEEAVIVAEVAIDKDKSPNPDAIPEGRWLVPYTGFMKWSADYALKLSEARYDLSPARKKAVEKTKAKYPD